MPLPTPNKGEEENDFIQRCIRFIMHENPNIDPKQATARAYSQWRGKEALHSDFQRILSNFFIKRYGINGIERFKTFLSDNKLDAGKPYNPRVQFTESFKWVEPLISYYREDTEAKYYLVRALTANISMNNNDYSDYEKMERAAETLSWRPVNINHNHERWLPFPRTRVDFTRADDASVEATLRVDNEDQWLQDALDNKRILHPSIEGRPGVNGMGEGYHFTGMALLEVGQELPGDPTTEIMPLVLNESVRASFDAEFKSLDSAENKIEEGKNLNKNKTEEFGDASFPDSCFAYVPDEAKGEDGNKSLRKLPYKNKDGSVDLDHVRNALARLDQTEEIPAAEKERIRKMFQNLLAKENPDYEPEEHVETKNKVMLENSEIKLENFNLRGDLGKEKAKNKDLTEQLATQKEDYERQIEKQSIEMGKVITENNIFKGQLLEAKENVTLTGAARDKAQKDYNELAVDTQKKLLKMKNDFEEMQQSRDDYKALSEKQGITVENDSAKHKILLEANHKLTTDLTETNEKLLRSEQELQKKTEKVEKAQKFMKWAYRELAKAGVAVTTD